ncbi:MAG: DUF4141 domain-containing protein [Rikenellaceae bacterium]
MRIKILILSLICCVGFTQRSYAVFGVGDVTFDPTNLAQSIANTSKNVTYSATTAANMFKAYEESVKIYEQGKKIYDALITVKNIISDSYKVYQSVVMLIEITEIYTSGYNIMLSNNLYAAEELSAIAYGYTRLLAESNEVITELKDIVSVTSLSMSDKERMDMVDKAYKEVRKYRNLVRYFTNKNLAVGYLRGKRIEEAGRITALYGSDYEKYW